MALSRLADHRGMTVTNMVIVTLVLGILSVPMAKFFTSNLKALTKETAKVAGQEELQGAMDQIERDLSSLNEVVGVSTATNGTSGIVFLLDSNQAPRYNPFGDVDGDGATNDLDPDDDNDMGDWNPAIPEWRKGSDLRDDDDNNELNYDALCRYYVDPQRQLIRQCLFDVAASTSATFPSPPGRNDVVARNVSRFTLVYFGNKREQAAQGIDNGEDFVNDVTPPVDAGEDDDVITQDEIDGVRPSEGGIGNRNQVLDGPELGLISSIQVQIEIDRNGDGNPEFRFASEIAPPLLSVKRLPGP